jgi:cell division protein FtsL
MTYIQPNQNKNILNRVIFGLVVVLLVNIFWLITLYNNTVNLSHNIAEAKTQLDSIGAKNTALNNQVLAALGSIQTDSIKTQNGLVEDNHPQYLSQSWPIASQR